MELTAIGYICQVEPVKQISEKFSTREFAIEIKEEFNGQTYSQFGKFQLTGSNRVDMIDNHSIGDKVKVSFNIRGREWHIEGQPKNYYTSLDVWKIEALAQVYEPIPPPPPPTIVYGPGASAADFQNSPSENVDDLPF